MNSLLDEESEIGDWINYKFTFTRSDKVECEAVSELSWLAAFEAMSSYNQLPTQPTPLTPLLLRSFGLFVC